MRYRKIINAFIYTCAFMLIGSLLQAQDSPTSYKIQKDKSVVFSIDRHAIETDLDSILLSFGVTESILNEIWSQKIDTSFYGWHLSLFSDDLIELTKGVSGGQKGPVFSNEMVLLESFDHSNFDHTFFPVANYGVNDFKGDPSVYDDSNGYTYFILKGADQASSVYLAGNFNSWSTLENPMYKTERGWETKIKLSPGKHLYKFIIDGKWVSDQTNKNKEEDGYENNNSIYYKVNHQFYLPGYTDAKRVVVAGSFNDWREKELRMEKDGLGWKIDMYVKEGTHAYKFIVDGEWHFDPGNKVVRSDGHGNENNYFSIGDTMFFALEGYRDAETVLVSGNFNVWNEQELVMERTSDGWKLPYVLAPGVYEYKFIVDGDWITDPDNPLVAGHEEYMNSVLVVKPNVKFILPKHNDANLVYLSGTFNDWNPAGFPMKREGDNWVTELYLRPGKYAYKYVVDGQWMADPYNELWEKNEWGTKNSVIWIDARDVYQMEN